MEGMGFQKVLVTCNEDNVVSEKVIVKNGGVRDNDFLETHGNIVKRFGLFYKIRTKQGQDSNEFLVLVLTGKFSFDCLRKNVRANRC